MKSMMFKTALAIVGCVAWASVPAHAGDAAAGKAKSESCAQCHGEDGKEDPAIAGMDEGNFTKAMKAYQSGERSHKKMQKAANALSDADLADLAAYYAGMK
jgi:cytochrome c553